MMATQLTKIDGGFVHGDHDDYEDDNDGFVHVHDFLCSLQFDLYQELGGATVHLVEPLPRYHPIHPHYNRLRDHHRDDANHDDDDAYDNDNDDDHHHHLQAAGGDRPAQILSSWPVWDPWTHCLPRTHGNWQT